MTELANRMEFFLSKDPVSDLERLKASLSPLQEAPLVVLRDTLYDELEGVVDAEQGVELKRRRSFPNLWCSAWRGRLINEPQGAWLSLTATPDRRLKKLVWLYRIAVVQGLCTGLYFFWQHTAEAYVLAGTLIVLSLFSAGFWRYCQRHYKTLARQDQEFVRRRLTEILTPQPAGSEGQENRYSNAA
jgi:hypothetical protein